MLHTLIVIALIAVAAGSVWGCRNHIALDRTNFRNASGDAALVLIVLITEHVVNTSVMGLMWASIVFIVQLLLLTRPWVLLLPAAGSASPTPVSTAQATSAPRTEPAASTRPAPQRETVPPTRPLPTRPGLGSTPAANAQPSVMTDKERQDFERLAAQFMQD